MREHFTENSNPDLYSAKNNKWAKTLVKAAENIDGVEVLSDQSWMNKEPAGIKADGPKSRPH